MGDAHDCLKMCKTIGEWRPLKKPKFKKVKNIQPDQKGIDLLVKCVKAPVAVEASADLKEVGCGDDTGIITVSLRSDAHAAVAKVGDGIRIQNAHVRMVKGRIRLVVDQWCAFKTADAGS